MSQPLEGQEVLVQSTHVTDPHDFYVRRVADDEWLHTFQEVAPLELQPAFSSSALPEQCALVVYKDPIRGWVRARVSHVHDETCLVALLDYGGSLHVNTSSLHPLMWGDARRPMALHCRLNFCAPLDGKCWSARSIATFVDYMGTAPVRITVMRILASGQLEVEVQNHLHDTISMLMVVAEQARFTSTHQQVNCLQPDVPTASTQRQYYIFDGLIQGAETEVRIISISDQFIQVVKEDRYEAYLKMNDLIKDIFCICDKLESEDVVENMAVVWRDEKRSRSDYHRCLVVRSEAEDQRRVLVLLVDRGEDYVVPVGQLRIPTARLLEQDTFAVACQLSTAQAGDAALQSLVVPGASLTVRTEQLETDTQPNIIEIV